MKKTFFLLSVVVAGLALLSFKPKPKLLLFAKTAGFHHASISAGIEAIRKIGLQNGFDMDTTTDASAFTDKNLKQYTALLFLSTTGTLFDTVQKAALQRYVEGGGGLIGVHAATDAEYNWPWWNRTIGAWFLSHPKQQSAALVITDSLHPATKGLPARWSRFDEWYNFKNINPAVHTLITLDESSYEGGKNGSFHPVAWWQNAGRGLVFYTALGHTDESYAEPLFLRHLTGGILFVLKRGR